MPAYSGINYDPGQTADDRAFFDQLDDFQNLSASPMEDVPLGSWEYKAVKHLAELGFIEGYDADKFLSDRPVTRYEMAVVVDKIMQKYLEWTDTGKITTMRKIRVEMPKVTLPDPLQEVVSGGVSITF